MYTIAVSSHGVLSCPLSGSGLVLWLVGLVDLSDLWHEGIVWVWVGQKRADGQEHLGDGEGWRPLLFQDIETDGAVRVDVWMIDPGREVDLGWLEWVVRREMDVQEEHTSSVR